MSFMLFIGPIIGVAVAIIAAVVIISVVAAAVAQKDINDYRLDASIATQLKKVKQQFIDKNRRIV